MTIITSTPDNAPAQDSAPAEERAQAQPAMRDLTNRIVVSGVVQPLEHGGRTRNDLGAQVTELEIQVLTPYGQAFALPVALAATAQEQWELRKRLSRRVVVEGAVQLSVEHDQRYANDDDMYGPRVRRMELMPAIVRPVGPDEPLGASAVILEGTVVGLPKRRLHSELSGVRYAEVLLRCTTKRTVALGGITVTSEMPQLVRVAVVQGTRDCGILYHPGNKVRVTGSLDCILVRWMPEGAEDSAAFQQVKAEWDGARSYFEERNVRRLGRERERYYDKVRGLELTPRWHVLASEIEGIGEARTGRLRWPLPTTGPRRASVEPRPAEATVEHAAPALEGEAASVEAVPLVEPVPPARTRRKVVRASTAERVEASIVEAAPVVEGVEADLATSTSAEAVTPAEEATASVSATEDEEEPNRNEGAAPPASETDEPAAGETTT
ncbi:MAG TPA: hypothetical protein VFS21_08170 [Roseiflexaceae bacterium]|nr:hypothetical protein [Roseiflexaceae bacterium]